MSIRIVYLTFYFKPDLCAGSFRNSPLVLELGKQASELDKEIIIDVFTTLPNRYSTFTEEAPAYEEWGNIRIHRINIPSHKSGFIDQIFTFRKYYFETLKLSKRNKYDLVVASSSRLFTAYLGYKLANRNQAKLYLDIRDIFVDTINDVIKSKPLKWVILPILKYVEKKVFNYASHINLISKGFKSYFEKFKNTKFTYYTNGIDPEFIDAQSGVAIINPNKKTKNIIYAGNIGEGQGLHKIIPQAAKLLGQEYNFIVIGDGGAKPKLISAIDEIGVTNVEIRNPVKRNELIEEYLKADYLFIHLNDYAAFEKVLPSKIFELGVFNKIMLAGVNGYAREFISENLKNAILFDSGDANSLVHQLLKYNTIEKVNSQEFIRKFNRKAVNFELAKSVLSYI